MTQLPPNPPESVPDRRMAQDNARQKALDELQAIGARVKAKRDADPGSPFAAQWFQLAALIGQIEAQIASGLASPVVDLTNLLDGDYE